MIIHNIHFCGEIRKISVILVGKSSLSAYMVNFALCESVHCDIFALCESIHCDIL